MKSTMVWADYLKLIYPDYFYITKILYDVQRVVYNKSGIKITGATHPTRRFEYPWAYTMSEEGERCLDAGGGIGPFCFILKERYKQITVLELDKDMVDTLHIITPEGFPLVAEVGDLCNMSYPDNYFDDVFCLSVLEHGPVNDDIIGAVDELLRVTKRRLILTMDVGEKGGPSGPLTFEKLEKFTDYFNIKRPVGPMQMLDSYLVSQVEPLAVACIVMDKTK